MTASGLPTIIDGLAVKGEELIVIDDGLPVADGGLPEVDDGLPVAYDGLPEVDDGLLVADDGLPVVDGGLPALGEERFKARQPGQVARGFSAQLLMRSPSVKMKLAARGGREGNETTKSQHRNSSIPQYGHHPLFYLS